MDENINKNLKKRTDQPIIAETAATCVYLWDSSQPIVIGQARRSRG